MKYVVLVAVILGFAMQAEAANSVIDTIQSGYKASGAEKFDAKRGEKMWAEKHLDAESGKEMNCATCHGTDLTKAGSHYRTGKVIEPMSLKVNPERFTDEAKIEKWFMRNCKGTWGRECTVQEKGDFLEFLRMQ